MAFITTTADNISSGGTITGDLTISGDLTVEGNGAGNYDEIVEGNLVLTSGSKLGVGMGDAVPDEILHLEVGSGNIAQKLQSGSSADVKTIYTHAGTTLTMGLVAGNSFRFVHGTVLGTTAEQLMSLHVVDHLVEFNAPVGIGTATPAGSSSAGILDIENVTASSATQGGNLRLGSNDGAVMASGHRLGVVEFAGAEDTSSTMTVGAKIEALADATWSDTENGADMVFYTTDGNASQSEVMRLTADNNVGIGTSAPSTLAGNSWTDIELQVKGTSGGGSMAVSGATQALSLIHI